jgi:SSS family solute:Na+ symporter
MPQQHWPDLLIMAAYLATMVSVGVRFSRKQTGTESYFVAKRRIPSWAMGFSIVATLITSVTFVAYPGSSYSTNWSLLVPGSMVVIALVVVGSTIIPFYRHAIGMSAYEYFGKRFGRPTRTYSSIAFSLSHFSKMGFIFYLLALTINSMTGWNTDLLILAVGAATVFYTVVGGLEAVIWTDVIQGFVIWIGVFIALGFLLFLPPGGPQAVFAVAWTNHKFSLGTFGSDFSNQQNIYVLVLYGFFWYLQKYTADQTVVQRYLVAKTDRAALRGVALGALLCVPVWTLFMLVGTCTWAFYRLTGETLPVHIKADQVFPYFLTMHLPIGIAGLFMASLMGAAMSGLASDLNALALVGVEDIYRSMRPQATDEMRLRGGKWIVAIAGVLCIVIGIILAHAPGGALLKWFSLSAIFSGGLAGLFLLAFFSTRANRQGIYIGILATILFTAWATATSGEKKFLDLPVNYPWHDLTIGTAGHVVLLIFGYLGSLFFPPEPGALSEMTFWKWVHTRKTLNSEPAPVTS